MCLYTRTSEHEASLLLMEQRPKSLVWVTHTHGQVLACESLPSWSKWWRTLFHSRRSHKAARATISISLSLQPSLLYSLRFSVPSLNPSFSLFTSKFSCSDDLAEKVPHSSDDLLRCTHPLSSKSRYKAACQPAFCYKYIQLPKCRRSQDAQQPCFLVLTSSRIFHSWITAAEFDLVLLDFLSHCLDLCETDAASLLPES